MTMHPTLDGTSLDQIPDHAVSHVVARCRDQAIDEPARLIRVTPSGLVDRPVAVRGIDRLRFSPRHESANVRPHERASHSVQWAFSDTAVFDANLKCQKG